MVVLKDGIWKHELVSLMIEGKEYTDEDFGVIIPTEYVESFKRVNFSTRAYFIKALEWASKAEIEKECGDYAKAIQYENEMKIIMESGATRRER